jgi:hypothetical protein
MPSAGTPPTLGDMERSVYKILPHIQFAAHPDSHLHPLDLEYSTLHSCAQIAIPPKITAIKKRMHGRQRTILRTLLSDRTREMQTHLALNKLRLVIRMVLPKPPSSLNFADLKDKNGNRMTDQIKIDLAASSTMKEWIGIPPTLHPLSRSFEDHPDQWKQLLNGTYVPNDSNIPADLWTHILPAFQPKSQDPRLQAQLHTAMNSPFTLKEFYKARTHLVRDKSPGPSGVTSNQIKAWGPITMETMFNLSNLMWQHKAVPAWWQDRLIILLPKEPGWHPRPLQNPSHLFI